MDYRVLIHLSSYKHGSVSSRKLNWQRLVSVNIAIQIGWKMCNITLYDMSCGLRFSQPIGHVTQKNARLSKIICLRCTIDFIYQHL